MHASVAYPPIEPIPEIQRWAAMLQRVASEPLEFLPNFPAIAQRYEAWWHQQADRPIFMGEVNANPARPITRRLDLLDQPDAWYEAKFRDLQQIHRVGDTLPNIRADFGAVLMGGLYGGDREESADTSWTVHYIDDDWSNTPEWTALREDNPWLQRMRSLLQRAAQGRARPLSRVHARHRLQRRHADHPARLYQAVYGSRRPPGRHPQCRRRHLRRLAPSLERALREYGRPRRGHVPLLRPVVGPALYAAGVRSQRADQPAALPGVLPARHRTSGRHSGPGLFSPGRAARGRAYRRAVGGGRRYRRSSSRRAQARRRPWSGWRCSAKSRPRASPCWSFARRTNCWNSARRWTRTRWPCWWKASLRRTNWTISTPSFAGGIRRFRMTDLPADWRQPLRNWACRNTFASTKGTTL